MSWKFAPIWTKWWHFLAVLRLTFECIAWVPAINIILLKWWPFLPLIKFKQSWKPCLNFGISYYHHLQHAYMFTIPFFAIHFSPNNYILISFHGNSYDSVFLMSKCSVSQIWCCLFAFEISIDLTWELYCMWKDGWRLNYIPYVLCKLSHSSSSCWISYCNSYCNVAACLGPPSHYIVHSDIYLHMFRALNSGWSANHITMHSMVTQGNQFPISSHAIESFHQIYSPH